MAELDELISRLDAEIVKNDEILKMVKRMEASRQYRQLSFEKATGEVLL